MIALIHNEQGQGFLNDSVKLEHLVNEQYCILLDDIVYTDSNGRDHVVRSGFHTDGASIPRVMWRLVGHPFMRKHLPASVTHDAYYAKLRDIPDKKAREALRLSADQLFLEMLKHLGVSWWRRKAMYRAVRVGGRWAVR